MNKYESVLIMKPNLTEKEKQDELDNYKKMFESFSNKEVTVEDLGKKRLAYEVRGNKEGNYAVFNYYANEGDLAETERKFRMDDNVIKFLSIRQEQELEQEDENFEDDEMEV